MARARGYWRLKDEKAWTLLTALDDLKGHEENIGARRPKGWTYSREFGGPNWLDLRKAKAEFKNAETAVLVVGGARRVFRSPRGLRSAQSTR